MSRTTNSLNNIFSSIFSKFLLIGLNFLTRTVFIRTLGEDYLGIGGLFTNILTVLSLAELGIESSIIFKLYKPIEEKDENKIIALMHLFRQLYIAVGCVVLVLGICVTPFLPYIIKDYDRLAPLGINPVLILMLYVFRSASSYWFFSYKQAIVYAHQKRYLLTVRGYLIAIASCAAQILVLLYWDNPYISKFIAYTITIILFEIIERIIFAAVSDRHFPYLKKKTEFKLSKEEIRGIFKDCEALLIYKANGAVISATDTIALSAMVSLSAVGIYANYRMLFSNIRSLLTRVMEGIGAAIGSIHAVGNLAWKRSVFRITNFAAVLMYGTVSVSLAVLGDEFILLWLGKEKFVVDSITAYGHVIPISLSYLIGLELYVVGMVTFLNRFRNSFGLFRQLKFRPVLSMIINLVLTVTLVPIIGVAGTVISTIAAYLFTNCIFDPIVIIDYELHISKKEYFAKNAGYALVTAAAGVTAWFLVGLVKGNGWLFFIIHGFMSVGVSLAFYLVFFGRSAEMRALLQFLPRKGPLGFLGRLLNRSDSGENETESE